MCGKSINFGKWKLNLLKISMVEMKKHSRGKFDSLELAEGEGFDGGLGFLMALQSCGSVKYLIYTTHIVT